MSVPPTKAFKLAPSDLTFLWDECKRCFWLKVNGVLKRPSAPFPKIFSRMDQQTKDFYLDKRTREISKEIGNGRIAFGERWVRSSELEVPGHERPVVLAGKIDTAIRFDDDSWGIIDFKTSEPRDEHVAFYSRQLHCYAVAAENPAPGALDLFPVTQLGLVVIEPIAMVGLEGGVAYRGDVHFLEIERDDDWFRAFLSQVLFVLENPEPPEASPRCSYCTYLGNGAMIALTGIYTGGGT